MTYNQTEAEHLGYGRSNAAVTEGVLANLAAAIVSNRTAVETLTTTNAIYPQSLQMQIQKF